MLVFSQHPEQGRRVRHRTTGQEGLITAQMKGPSPWGRTVVTVFVRPVGGGVEWTAHPDDIEPV